MWNNCSYGSPGYDYCGPSQVSPAYDMCCGGYGGNKSSTFVLIVVLFILLIIVGKSFI